ncbi:MAG: orotidine-5'-phosphate decarboxylase [Luteibaculaceae bacterium]
MQRNQLINEIKQKRSFLCVGLDTDPAKIPTHLEEDFYDPIFEFNKRIIDATKDYAVAYKPNLAFYESLGGEGYSILQRTLEYIPDNCLIIADAKRGDIGNTSNHYAKAFFDLLNCHAITINPYMGEDSVTPFLEYKDKWAVVLALTSNKGSQNFQMQKLENGQFLFEKVLEDCANMGSDENVMFVVGATHPEMFAKVRKIVPNHFLLVPGVGAQGGDLESICAHGLNSDCGLLVNVSRALIYASDKMDFPLVAQQKAKEIQQQMEKILLEKGII